MSRPRRLNKHLPRYVRIKHGAYHYRGTKLCRVEEGEAKMYEMLAKRKALPDLDRIPAAVAEFKLKYLPTLSQSARKEHDRLLTVFSDEFTEFRVSEVRALDIRKAIHNLYAGKLSAARAFKSRVSSFFTWCVSVRGLLDVNPCREVIVKKPPKTKTLWTDALFWSAREHLNPMIQCYHDLSFLLYQRTTDVRLLMRSQARDGIIHFEPTKTEDSSGAAVDIPITPAIQEVLDRAASLAKLRAGPGGDAPVIQTGDGSTYTRSGVYSAYRRADEALHGEAIGLNPKALRPYAATVARRMGYSKDQIQVGLAHVSIRTTEGYIQQHEVPVSQVAMRLPDRKN